MRTILVLIVVGAALLFARSVGGEDVAPPAPGYCGVVLPGTYYGEVRTVGFEAQAGSVLIARTEQFAWQAEPLTDRGYVVDVYQRLDHIYPPCFSGGVVTFTLDGHRCWPWRLWSSGAHEVDLLCVDR